MTEPTYLVTGSMGCLGAWALYHLVKQGHHPISFDVSDNRSRLDLLLSAEEQQAITFVKGDLTSFDQVLGVIRDHNITNIVHLAALQIPFCRANPVLGAQVNVVGTVNIFEAAKQVGLKHIAYASSIAVYGPASMYPQIPVPHDAPHAPDTLYGTYKVANENTARIYWQDHGISGIAFRPYSIYGVGRDQGLTSDPTKALLAAVKGEALQINFVGETQFQLASDVALQFIDAATTPMQGSSVYNLGTPIATVEDFVGYLKEFRPDAQINYGGSTLPFPSGFDDTMLRTNFAKVYQTPLREGIQQTLEHFERCVSAGKL
jgi:nucleoside-diphosphate-sugar epimerase